MSYKSSVTKLLLIFPIVLGSAVTGGCGGGDSAVAPPTDNGSSVDSNSGGASQNNPPVKEIPRSLTQGKISFTFDDGFKSVFDYALPILAAQDVPGTAYITTDFIGTDNYMAWGNVRSLQNDYHWEIGSHSLTHPELPTIDYYQREIVESKSKLIQQGLKVTTFATPFGAYDNNTLQVISRHYSMHRGFWDRDDLNTFPYNNTVLMVESVQRDTSMQHIFDLLEKARDNNMWLILVFHEVLPKKLPNYEYTTFPEDLRAILDYSIAIGLSVVTINHMDNLRDYNIFPALPDQVTLSDDNRNIADWSKDHQSIHVAQGSGRFPGSDKSIIFQGADRNIHLFTPAVNINSSKVYGVKSFADLLELTAGEVGFHIDEYNAQGNWLSNVYLGSLGPKQIKEFSIRYVPSNQQVERISLQVYMTAGSQGTAMVDDLQLYQLPD